MGSPEASSPPGRSKSKRQLLVALLLLLLGMSMSLDAAVAFSSGSTQDSDGGDDEGDVCRFLELQCGSSTVLYVPY